MTRARVSVRAGGLVGVLACGLLAVLGLAAPQAEANPTPAPTAPGFASGDPNVHGTADVQGNSDVQITLDRMSPSIATKSSTLRISGSVVNASRDPIDNVRVGLRKGSAPIADRADLERISAEPTTPRGGSPDDVELPGSISKVTDRLEPGDRAGFTLEIPLSSMGLPEPGTYVIGVEAIGSVTTGDVRLADLRTFLPWYPPDSITPINVVWLWPLADWPARTATGVLLDDRTPTELSPGGRLDRLVDIGRRHTTTVSWVADPELLQTAADMSDGYLVEVDDRPLPGDNANAAKAWIDHVQQATASGSRLRVLPYADVDASALTRAGMTTDVVRSVTQAGALAQEAVGGFVPGTMYWAPFGRLDRPALNVLASAGVTDVVLSSGALPPTDASADVSGSPIATLPTSVGSIRAILADSDLTAALALPQQSRSDVITARQRFLASSALLAQNLQTQSGDRTVVVAPPSVRWDPAGELVNPLLRATKEASWLRPMTLAGLTGTTTSVASRQRGGYGTKARSAELTEAYMASVRKVTERLDAFTSVLDDPTGVSEPYSAALMRAVSSAWRTQPETGEKLVRTTSDELAEQTDLVRVLSAGTITFSGDSGRVPVTIANDLDRAVTVGLRLEGVPALRLESEPLTGIRIEPGKMASVDLDARVVGGDPLPVLVQLITPEAEPFATPARITVTSTAYARAAAWVVAVAFFAIVIFVIVGVYRRIHAARTTRQSPTS